MKPFSAIAIAVVLVTSSAYGAPTEDATASHITSAKGACALFRFKYPDHTFYPNSSAYIFETQTQYWSATEYEGPQCVFLPQNAEQVAFAVSSMVLSQTQFAVRGGGHMPISGYNNIDSSGVLLSTTNLSTLALSTNKSVLSVGPGNKWRTVYDFLQPYGLSAIGGRVGGVGVPGYLLGVKYECVLASGHIVEVTAINAYSDLFWALKGGGNSFCIVTRFDIKTVSSPEVWVGLAQYDSSQKTKYLDAVYNFGKYGSLDSKAAIIPTIVSFPSLNLSVYSASKFYDSLVKNATPFENFTAPELVPTVDTYALQPLSNYITAIDALQPDGLRQQFTVMSSIVDRSALDIIHDIFLLEVSAQLSGVSGLQTSLTFQPITKELIQQGVNKGGNPQGVDISKTPYFWIVENWSWTSPADDATIYAFSKFVTDNINAQLKAKGLQGTYLYMNDAGKGQQIFQNYPAANLARLKSIRAKYDPLQVYTKLMLGGWKVLNA